jgi:hypothetical protein
MQRPRVTGKPRLLPLTAVAGKEHETGLAKAELHVVYKVNIVVDLTYIHGGLSYDGVMPGERMQNTKRSDNMGDVLW